MRKKTKALTVQPVPVNENVLVALSGAVASAEANLLAARQALDIYQGGAQPVPPVPQIPPQHLPDLPAFNSAAFFDAVRVSLYGGALNQGQVDGINLIVQACVFARLDPFVTQAAFMLGQIHHETAFTNQPIEEICGSSTSYAPFFGRGHIQLTHAENYQRQEEKLGAEPAIVASGIPWQVYQNVDYALHPKTSAIIAVAGCRDADFTGVSISDYVNEDQTDYVEGRRVINGTDRQEQIAVYCREFEVGLRTGFDQATQ